MPEESVWERAQAVSLLVSDVDGVLTDGSVYTGADGETLKAFHIHDGKGIRLLQDAGIAVAWITARASAALERRAGELGVTDLIQGSRAKGAALATLCEEHGIAPGAAAFIGDDLVDLPAMAAAGLSVAVADAHPSVQARADWVTRRPGGRGAVRELCELILAAQGHLDALIDDHG
ncbi:HAD hydrolase family protein [Ectothiorhodospiraceae bacterium WFHF3C12]|nr:HAD hydrolase family protein [Ectothiorhodospiraceae bacterium WFHF3C12]